jgi:hypothetical protein
MAFPDGQQALIEKVMTQNPASAGFFVAGPASIGLLVAGSASAGLLVGPGLAAEPECVGWAKQSVPTRGSSKGRMAVRVSTLSLAHTAIGSRHENICFLQLSDECRLQQLAMPSRR